MPYQGRTVIPSNQTNRNYVNPNPNYINPNAARKDAHIPAGSVTPEQAQKLYNRPKTNPPPKFDRESQWPRIAGEFEKQNAIMVSLSELLPQHGKVFRRIAELTEGHIKLVVLFNKPQQVVDALKALDGSKKSLDHVHFLNFELDTVWLRDFGPIVGEQPDGQMCFDFFYNGQRPVDDHFPREWAKLTDATHNSIPWTLQGGNLLTNGAGLALTTTRLFDDNKISFPPRRGVDPVKEQQDFILEEFRKYTNLKQIVVLEPLAGEKTKHVDMFASFVRPGEVLIASVDRRRDPVNAAILDRNARRLQQLKVDGKPLKVTRIPYPVRRGTAWSPYTNVIIANKLVMIPATTADDRATLREAIDVWRRALPDHRVATVDITSMAKLEGALHCMSVNVPSYAPLPDEKLVSYRRALKWAEEKEHLTSK